MSHIWCNGQWLEPSLFRVAPTDRGLLHGLGLFETILAIDGRPVFAGHHLKRFARGCERLGWRVQTTDLAQLMIELLKRNGHGTGLGRIRLALTAGSGALDNLSQSGDHLLWMTASAISEAPETMTVCMAPFPRNEHSPLAGLKCASYAENNIALDHARRHGFQEILFFNTAAHLCEAATANVFLAQNGELLTPSLDSGCLPGITRAVVMDIAAKLGIPCREARLVRDDLLNAGEIFLTSSTRGPVAVTRVEDQPFKVGEITATIRRAWSGLVAGAATG